MKKHFLAAALIFAVAALPYALDFSVRLEPDPRLDKSIFLTAQIDAEPFARAALLASGADPQRLEERMAQLNTLWAELLPGLKGLQAEEMADKILFFIYQKLLAKYDFFQTRVDFAIETGVYNCVSSAALFMFFCKKAGIPVVANECVRHAFCSIYQDEKLIDVETTNPYGVNPGKKRGEALGNGKTQWITVPAKDYAGRHQIDDRRLVGIIYCNRISQLQKKKLDDQTVGLAVDAYEVQGRSPLSRSELDICVANASGMLTKAEREEDAIAFLKSAQEIFGPSQNWTKRFFTNYHNLVLGKIKANSFEEGLAQVELNKQNLEKKDYEDLKEYAYLTGAQAAAKQNDWRAAIKIAQAGLEELPNSKKIFNNKKAYEQNLAVDYHNAAVDLFNAGQKDKALETIKAGLNELPQNKLLQTDLSKMSSL